MSETFNNLCKKYINALDSENDVERLGELEDEITELRGERDQFVEDYGEDDVLVEQVEDELEELMDEKKELQEAIDQVDKLERDILEMVSSEFIAEESYLTKTSLEALNHIFTGERKPKLLIEDWVVDQTIDLNSNVRTITDYIRKLAMAKLGTDNSLKECWNGIEGGKRLDPFVTVAKADMPLGPSEVAKRIDGDIDRRTAGNRLRDAIHHAEYSPYHRVEGDYTLSTVGSFMYQEYYDGETEEGPEESEGEEIDEQVTLEETGETNE